MNNEDDMDSQNKMTINTQYQLINNTLIQIRIVTVPEDYIATLKLIDKEDGVEFRDYPSDWNKQHTARLSTCYELEELGLVEPVEEAWHQTYRLTHEGKQVVKEHLQ